MAEIQGYRDLFDSEIDAINEVKRAEEQLANVWTKVREGSTVDRRWLAVARTHFEEGFSALVRSIARPTSPFGE